MAKLDRNEVRNTKCEKLAPMRKANRESVPHTAKVRHRQRKWHTAPRKPAKVWLVGKGGVCCESGTQSRLGGLCEVKAESLKCGR